MSQFKRFSPLWFVLMLSPWAVFGMWLYVKQKHTPKPAVAKVVVVYCALDRLYAQPILETFTRATGITVLPKWDTEATKTTGLVQSIRAERRNVRCDVFWNNELSQTIGLARDDLLTPYASPAAADLPAWARDPQHRWTGFAARARVLIVNTNLVPADQRPTSYRDLLRPKWKGRIGIAKPLFGTTATHAAALYAALGKAKAEQFFAELKANGVVVCAGNADVKDRVAAGELAFGWTDTDDANLAVQAKQPVAVVFPDQAPKGFGTLLIPNAVSIVRGGPNPETAQKLIDYLLSPEVEAALAKARSAQIPLRAGVARPEWIPATIRTIEAPWPAITDQFGPARTYLKTTFLD